MNTLESNNSYLGFTDGMKAMQRGRVESVLTKKYRFDGVVKERRDEILDLVMNGNETVHSVYDNTYGIYSDMTARTFYEVTKTEYEFANYLIENGFVSGAAVEAKIEEEKAERQRIKDEEKRLKEEETEKIIKRNEFKRWLDEEAMNYSDEEKIDLQKRIFIDKYGEYRIFAKRSLVLIDHFDDPMCKEELKNYLATRNTGTRKYFECVSGLKLPKTNKETIAFIDSITTADFKEPIPYKQRKKPVHKGMEIFYIAHMNKENGETEFVPREGEPLEKYGIKFFIHKEGGEVRISSVDCGFKLVSGRTKTEALENMRQIIKTNGKEKILEQIAKCGEKFGWSPLSYKANKQ